MPIASGGIEYGCVSWRTTAVGPTLTGNAERQLLRPDLERAEPRALLGQARGRRIRPWPAKGGAY